MVEPVLAGRRSSTTCVEPGRIRLAAGEPHRQHDVLGGGQRRHQVERLEDEADAVAAQLRELAVLEPAEVDVADPDRAAREPVESGERVHAASTCRNPTVP